MPKVTVDDMVQALRDADKPLTASGIADATGVTQQAISARRDELEADVRVQYGQVGNATAYWLAGGGEMATDAIDPLASPSIEGDDTGDRGELDEGESEADPPPSPGLQQRFDLVGVLVAVIAAAACAFALGASPGVAVAVVAAMFIYPIALWARQRFLPDVEYTIDFSTSSTRSRGAER